MISNSLMPFNRFAFEIFYSKKNIIMLMTILQACLLMGGVGCEFLMRHRTNQSTKDFIDSIKTKSCQTIEPVPSIKTYESFQYSAQHLRNPFELFQQSMALHLPPSVLAKGPDVSHQKEALEAFPLDVLQMVGTLERDEQRFALVKDTQGIIHRVTVGNFMGQHFGKIINITDDRIEIVEWISTLNDNYHNRCHTLYLNPNSRSLEQDGTFDKKLNGKYFYDS